MPLNCFFKAYTNIKTALFGNKLKSWYQFIGKILNNDNKAK